MSIEDLIEYLEGLRAAIKVAQWNKRGDRRIRVFPDDVEILTTIIHELENAYLK